MADREHETSLDALADQVLEFEAVEWETVIVTELAESEEWLTQNLREVARIGAFERGQQNRNLDEFQPGESWGEFEIVALVETGRTGVIYRAHDPESDDIGA